MNLPDAFYTSRVTEALDSLALHVTSARNIAASLRPIKTAGLNLTEEEEPRPIITSISPRKTHRSKTDPKGQVIPTTFTIEGKNLTADSVKGFQLFWEGDASTFFSATSVRPKDDPITGFTGDVELSTAPFGFYELRITDGTPHLPGFVIEIEADDGPLAGLGTPPKISNVSKSEDNELILTVEASGTEPLSYTWIKDSVPTGTTDKTLKIGTTARRGNYSVIVTNAAGWAISDVVTIR